VSEEEECEQPCEYGSDCGPCGAYWARMVAEGLWEPGKGWTQAGMAQIVSGQNRHFGLRRVV
jgi:hypothetical protein